MRAAAAAATRAHHPLPSPAAASAAAPAPAPTPARAFAPARAPKPRPVPPLYNYFGNTNHSQFSTFWLAVKAAHLDEWLNRTDTGLTVFAPTNAAWEKRLPSLTRELGLDVKTLFSEGKSQVLNEIIKYHMLSSRFDADKLASAGRVTTMLNLGSDAKDLDVADGADGRLALLASDGGYAQILDRGVRVNKSIVYAIDDVLLPSAVTVPTKQALGQADLGKVSAEVWADADIIARLQSVATGGAASPTAGPLPDEFRRRRRSGGGGGGGGGDRGTDRRSSPSSSRRSGGGGGGGSDEYSGDVDDGADAVAAQSADFGGEDRR
jgi:uncharacterized surface protein with fasciclin (FAS1) repeats